MPGKKRLTLPKKARLQRPGEFAQLRQHGRRATRGCLIANWAKLPAGASSRLGVVTGRKVGNAVERARARRLLRETFRLRQHALRAPVALVLVARPSIQGRTRLGVEADFLNLLRDAGLLRPAETPHPGPSP